MVAWRLVKDEDFSKVISVHRIELIVPGFLFHDLNRWPMINLRQKMAVLSSSSETIWLWGIGASPSELNQWRHTLVAKIVSAFPDSCLPHCYLSCDFRRDRAFSTNKLVSGACLPHPRGVPRGSCLLHPSLTFLIRVVHSRSACRASLIAVEVVPSDFC
jgi:hypothetical protein